MDWTELQDIIHIKIRNKKPLAGGDISTVYQLETHQGNFVIKINEIHEADMLDKESRNLKILANTGVIRVPKVVDSGTIGKDEFLLLENIPQGVANEKTFREFGEQLAALHKITNNRFGLDYHNYIGSLFQSNLEHELWHNFYWYERIRPQFVLAVNQGFYDDKIIENEKQILNVFQENFEDCPPVLLHGDLWNGNFVIDINSHAVVLDPAVYFGHPAMDIAMTRLFGGFPEDFYQSYFANSTCKFSNSAIELAQLYYLLVHLNLFGKSYLGKVNSILNKYIL
ncbi:MAG: fructosamine kinase family protein [Flavobacteriaceae bacterium]|nr:fructosamine kinase family protein [Flavobacteriaceae bacterium]